MSKNRNGAKPLTNVKVLHPNILKNCHIVNSRSGSDAHREGHRPHPESRAATAADAVTRNRFSKPSFHVFAQEITMRCERVLLAATGLVLAMAAPSALAHTHGAAGAGFGAGFSHPFLGLDHLAAMVAVGMWAAQSGWRPVWSVPLAFMSVLALGAVLAFAGVALPGVEAGIAASLLVLGLLIAAAVRFSPLAGAVIAAVFAVFHGHAHGTEIPQALAPWLYVSGFLLATGLLHAAGIATGRYWAARREWLVRATGLALGAGGAWMLLT
jgi:urease accessory protein